MVNCLELVDQFYARYIVYVAKFCIYYCSAEQPEADINIKEENASPEDDTNISGTPYTVSVNLIINRGTPA